MSVVEGEALFSLLLLLQPPPSSSLRLRLAKKADEEESELTFSCLQCIAKSCPMQTHEVLAMAVNAPEGEESELRDSAVCMNTAITP